MPLRIQPRLVNSQKAPAPMARWIWQATCGNGQRIGMVKHIMLFLQNLIHRALNQGQCVSCEAEHLAVKYTMSVPPSAFRAIRQRPMRGLAGVALATSKRANTACTRLVGVAAFSGSLRGLKWVPAKWRCLVPPTSG